jgi:hypothetical protein
LSSDDELANGQFVKVNGQLKLPWRSPRSLEAVRSLNMLEEK